MLVITLTDCPAALRGDLTKWLQELNTGVYVGQVGARVREELWKRVKENIKTGRATMVYSANNEQRMNFRVHNSGWEPIDFDGLKLMLRPSPARAAVARDIKTGYSKAAQMHMAKRMSEKKNRGGQLPDYYAVVDVETTGLIASEHEIIEIGAVKVAQNQVAGEYHALIKIGSPIPPSIEKLTGLCNDLLNREGRDLSQVMPEFLAFIGDLPIVSHNAAFDFDFLRTACSRHGLPLISNRCIDTLSLSRRLVSDVENYKLSTLLFHFGIVATGAHRTLSDCLSTKQLYEKLIEIMQGQE